MTPPSPQIASSLFTILIGVAVFGSLFALGWITCDVIKQKRQAKTQKKQVFRDAIGGLLTQSRPPTIVMMHGEFLYAEIEENAAMRIYFRQSWTEDEDKVVATIRYMPTGGKKTFCIVGESTMLDSAELSARVEQILEGDPLFDSEIVWPNQKKTPIAEQPA